MLVDMIKKIIERGFDGDRFTKEGLLEKLDIFLLGDRITADEYEELKKLIEAR